MMGTGRMNEKIDLELRVDKISEEELEGRYVDRIDAMQTVSKRVEKAGRDDRSWKERERESASGRTVSYCCNRPGCSGRCSIDSSEIRPPATAILTAISNSLDSMKRLPRSSAL